MPKNIFTSKTIWWNLLTIIVAVAATFGYTPDQDIAEKVSVAMVIASPIINIALRFLTKQPISFTTK